MHVESEAKLQQVEALWESQRQIVTNVISLARAGKLEEAEERSSTLQIPFRYLNAWLRS